MTIRTLPKIEALSRPKAFEFEIDEAVMAKWNQGLRAQQSAENTISMLDVIGEDYWTGGGVTAEKVSAELKRIGDNEVFVDMNSPGGDVFEGIAIYNILRAHKQKVTIRVLGWAASAASVITMAGDRIEIDKSAFMMLHNAWGLVIGNQFDLQESLDILQPIDDSMASVYSDRSGATKEKAAEWMSRNRGGGTWFNGEQAIDAGLADEFLSVSTYTDGATAKAVSAISATRRIDMMMAKSGIPRSERRSLLSEVKGGMSGAAPTATQDAGDDWLAAAKRLTETMRL